MLRIQLVVLSLFAWISAFAHSDSSSVISHLLNPTKGYVVFNDTPPAKNPVRPASKWYETLQIRGYAQFRYNRLLETNPSLKCEQCDRSWGEDGGFSFRRIRVIFFGNIHERVYLYLQPDFASSASTTGLHFAQIRDMYIDVALNASKSMRLRFGQSKVPYGFENMQSSQNRIPLDRNDALNSAVANERDIGTFFYWAPAKIRERFSYLVSSGLKGSGDYGVLGFGVYNGQIANRPEANNTLHKVIRLTYPFQFRNKQILEPGIQYYTGKYVVNTVTSGKSVKGINADFEYLDERIAATFVWYPQPFGIVAEYNIGTGPEYNPATNTIEQRKLEGGYTMLNYYIKTERQTIIPFVRYQYYKGGKKHETDARSYRVFETEAGIEWQPYRNLEFVAMYTLSDRTFVDAAIKDNRQTGRLLRLQVQCNF
ncbi:MAG: porin [Bacteroidota bacterium]